MLLLPRAGPAHTWHRPSSELPLTSSCFGAVVLLLALFFFGRCPPPLTGAEYCGNLRGGAVPQVADAGFHTGHDADQHHGRHHQQQCVFHAGAAVFIALRPLGPATLDFHVPPPGDTPAWFSYSRTACCYVGGGIRAMTVPLPLSPCFSMAEQACQPSAQAIAARLYPRRYGHFVPYTTQQTMPHTRFAQIPNVKVMHARCALQKGGGKPGAVPTAVKRYIAETSRPCPDNLCARPRRCLRRAGAGKALAVAGTDERRISEVVYCTRGI